MSTPQQAADAPKPPPAGSHEFLAQDRVVWGKPAAQAALEEAERRGARRVFILTGRTLNRRTGAIAAIRDALGERHVGTFDECTEHTPRDSVLAAVRAARAAEPDLMLTVGGGTAIDTGKVMLIALAHGLERAAQFDDFRLSVNPDGTRRAPAIAPPPFRQVVVSTTLGAAEFSDLGGCTDPVRQVKDAYHARLSAPASVILDPAITVHTPEWLWLSTGVRGIDHAVEGLCSVESSPLITATALQALRLFADCLPRSRRSPDDLAARQGCLQAAWLAGLGILRVPYGASHGIGHSLGAVTGMSHGYTSCVMLPHVMRFNRDHARARQAQIAEALGRPGEDAADAVAALIAGLGLPVRLRDAGVTRDRFDAIARGAMQNLWVRTNPRPIDAVDQIVGLLDAAY